MAGRRPLQNHLLHKRRPTHTFRDVWMHTNHSGLADHDADLLLQQRQQQ